MYLQDLKNSSNVQEIHKINKNVKMMQRHSRNSKLIYRDRKEFNISETYDNKKLVMYMSKVNERVKKSL